MDTGFLEDWLRNISSQSSLLDSSPLTAPSAPQIAHAWTQLRASFQQGAVEPHHLTALKFLLECRGSLHIAQPQAKLLISILSSGASADAGQARSSAALLLSTWARKAGKSSASLRTNRAAAREARDTLELAVQSAVKVLKDRLYIHAFIGEAILLLGALASTAQISDESRRKCQEVVAEEFLRERHSIVQGRLAEALAGGGYAIVSSSGPHFAAILRAMIFLWSDEDRTSKSPPLKDGLMILHLMEWCSSSFRFQEQAAAMANVEVMVGEFVEAVKHSKTSAVRCTVVLGAAGLLKSLYKGEKMTSHRGQGVSGAEQRWQSIRRSLESVIVSISDSLLQPLVSMVMSRIGENAVKLTSMLEDAGCSTSHLERWLYISGLAQTSAIDRHCLQCTSLAMARCSGFPAHPSISLCLIATLLNDAMPVAGLYTAKIIDCPDLCHDFLEKNTSSEVKQGSRFSAAQSELESHVSSILFQEVGAIVRAMSQQYESSNEDWQQVIETLLWEYSKVLYQSHRLHITIFYEEASAKTVLNTLKLGNQSLEKVFEAIFFFIVLFSFAVRNTYFSRGEIQIHADDKQHAKGKAAVRILDSLSCVEFFREVHVPEYSSTLQNCVSQIGASISASSALVHLLPRYKSVVTLPGPTSGVYNWAKDQVQTARILFYFRVLPSCLGRLSESTFVSEVAPLMFLYMLHPKEKVAQASHALFAAFLSCSSDTQLVSPLYSKEGGRFTLKEQLVVFYIQRALETFPGVTPFEGLVLGVGAIVRHLPSGSPATVHCVSCLAGKASELYGTCTEDSKSCADNSCEVQQRENVAISDLSEAARNIQTLLLNLVLLVDLQALPHVLRYVAKLILGLHHSARIAALEEAFDVLVGSDDMTRKPTIVPWLQSLSYLCSNLDAQKNANEGAITLEPVKIEQKLSDNGSVSFQDNIVPNDGSINLNPSLGFEEPRTRTCLRIVRQPQHVDDINWFSLTSERSRSRL